jgi:hypothetical protein
MRLISAAIIVIGLCFAAAGASANYFSPSQLPKIQAIQVEVEANVTGVCLDKLDALKTEAELILRRSGIKVVDDFSGHTLNINVVGYAITGGCSAYISLQTYVFETLTDGTNGLHAGPDHRHHVSLCNRTLGHQPQMRQRQRSAVTQLLERNTRLDAGHT